MIVDICKGQIQELLQIKAKASLTLLLFLPFSWHSQCNAEIINLSLYNKKCCLKLVSTEFYLFCSLVNLTIDMAYLLDQILNQIKENLDIIIWP